MGSIQLRPYQLDAVHKMKKGCILCGGVGSGKSITSIAYYYLKNGGSESLSIRNNRRKPVLIGSYEKA